MLHTFIPKPILLTLGPVNIYWYGLLMVIGIIAAIAITVRLGKKHQVSQDSILDLAFYLVLTGILGARVYDILLELPYYLTHPLAIFKIWQGGLAIHGALIAGALTIYWYAKKTKLSFIKLLAIIAPGLALGQGIGRWGNYFNQELFGRPTNLPWGIPINFEYRPVEFMTSQYFHPTFLYESLGDLAIFAILFYFVNQLSQLTDRTKRYANYRFIILGYLAAYSLLRFGLEFVRIDSTPTFLGLRWPQLVSLIVIIASATFAYMTKRKTLAKID